MPRDEEAKEARCTAFPRNPRFRQSLREGARRRARAWAEDCLRPISIEHSVRRARCLRGISRPADSACPNWNQNRSIPADPTAHFETKANTLALGESKAPRRSRTFLDRFHEN